MKDKDQIAIGLTKRISSGDRSAESELVSQYGGGLLIMLRQRTGDHQLANDLYQETFIIVIRRFFFASTSMRRTRETSVPT